MKSTFKILSGVSAGIALGWIISVGVSRWNAGQDQEDVLVSREPPTLLNVVGREDAIEQWRSTPENADPEERFRLLNRTTLFPEKAKSFHDLFRELTEKDPANAIALAKTVDGRTYAKAAWNAILQTISETSFEEAMRVTEEHRPEFVENVIARWAREEPYQALEYLRTVEQYINDDARYNPIAKALQIWGESDLNAVTTWWLEHRKHLSQRKRMEELSDLLVSRLNDEPKKVAALAMEHLQGEELISVVSQATAKAAHVEDAEEIMNWTREIDDPVFRTKTQVTLAKEFATISPDAAKTLFTDIKGRELKTEVSRSFVTKMLKENGPEEAAQWVEQIEDPVIRNNAILILAGSWGADSSGATGAAEYVLSRNLPPGKREAFLKQLGGRLFTIDVPSGMQWLDQLPSDHRTELADYLIEHHGEVLTEQQIESLRQK